MPSSTWRPWSDSRQRTSVSESSANQSMRSPMLQMPLRLIQPPRLVDDATSGATVTTWPRRPRAPRGRGRRRGARAPAGWSPSRCAGARARRAPAAARGARPARARSRAAAAAHSRPSGESAVEGAPRLARVGAQLLGEVDELLVVEQRRVVGRVALGGQRPALDRVGEDDRRAVADGVGRAVGGEQAPRGRGRRGRGRWRAARAGRGRRSAARSPAGRRRAGARAAASSSARSRRWYSSLPIASMRARRASPPSRSKSARRRRPYLTVSVCQPAASNIPTRRPAAMSGTTRSSDWRLRSTTHSTSPRRAHHRVDDRLPHGALVQLGVAQQRDLAPAARARRSARRRSDGPARPRSSRWPRCPTLPVE